MRTPLHTDAPLVLPRGRHAAPRQIVWLSQRERLLEAMTEAVAEKGYARAVVADAIARAGVSRKTFYEHFPNKEACFLAAWDAGVAVLLEEIERAIDDAAPDWLAAASAGTHMYLSILATNEAFARAFLIEVLAAGPEALARRAKVHERFAEHLAIVHAAARQDLDGLPEPSPAIFRACVGAIDELVCDELLAHGHERLPELLNTLLEVEVALLIGRDVVERELARRDP